MAFQLLTFFILTFKPAPVEGQVDLRLPPPMPVTKPGQPIIGKEINIPPKVVEGLDSLVVSIFPGPNGQIGSLAIGDTNVADLGQLDDRLKTYLTAPHSPFSQVILQVGAALRYEELMRMIDICTRQTMADGSKLSKLSFVELPEAGGD